MWVCHKDILSLYDKYNKMLQLKGGGLSDAKGTAKRPYLLTGKRPRVTRLSYRWIICLGKF